MTQSFTNCLGMKFHRIPAGSFMMGSPKSEDGRYEEEAQHLVTLSRPYYMAVYPVTQGEWEQVMGTSIEEQADKGSYSSTLCGVGERNPMYYVNWNECQDFIDMLNEQYKEELEQALGSGWEYHLPSETEWEYACRAGTNGPYGGTGELDTMGWYHDNDDSEDETQAVGGKEPNAWGLYDMHGNVFELCEDWFDDYPYGSVTDPMGPSYGTSRVRRGGDSSEIERNCRSASRSCTQPEIRYERSGFRLAIRMSKNPTAEEPTQNQAIQAVDDTSTSETLLVEEPTPAMDPNPASDFEYKKNNGTIMITQLKEKTMEDVVVIPAWIDGLPVTCIGNGAFQECRKLTEVLIPDGVARIEDYAFYGCSVFYSSSGLTTLTLPKSVTHIGNWAFYGCRCLTSITLSNGVAHIGNWAFAHCRFLTTLTLPKSVTHIGSMAFLDCENLTALTIPSSVTSVGAGAFGYCSQLSAVNVAPENVHYMSVDGVLFTKDGKTLHGYPSGKKNRSYTIPNGVTHIGDHAITECRKLKSITIPDGVTHIGNYAITECRKLTTITIPESVTHLGDYAFYGCDKLTTITIPESVTSIGNKAFEGCPMLTIRTPKDAFTAKYARENGIKHIDD